jgi:hypothetical protein
MSGGFMEPNYYLLAEKKILRMESKLNPIPSLIFKRLLDQDNPTTLSQREANHRVVIFRDEIIEYDEFLDYFNELE